MSEDKLHRSRILCRETVAANVHSFVIEKPDGFTFRPGQTVEFAIDEPKWQDDKHSFTLTSLLGDPRL